jgi:hypothetical protein
MTDFFETMEILIDQLILHLPSKWFVDAPFLATLLSNSNGRYVLAGILVVTGLIVLWVILLFLQVLFGDRFSKSKISVLQSADEQSKLPMDARSEGFKFFKRNRAVSLVADNELALKSIEKEMLIVRQRYSEGRIVQEVYVAETRRLYNRAKPLKP